MRHESQNIDSIERETMRSLILAVLAVAAGLAFLAAPAAADKIELENGDTIDVTIVSETEDSLVVQHPQLGEFTVPRSALKPPTPPNPGLFGTGFMEGWKRGLGAGFGGASGNSQDASANAELSFSKKTDKFRGDFKSTYFYASQNGVRNTNAFSAAYQHDFLLGESPLFIFVAGRYQYDQFQDWEQRISGNGGLGWDIISKKAYDLSARIGVGVARTQGTVQMIPVPAPPAPQQNFLIINRQWTPEGVVGVSGSWRPFEGHEFTADVTYFPNFSDFPEFRLLANAAYQIAIAPIDGLSLKFGMTDEYNDSINTNLPVPGVTPPRLQQKNNLKYYGNLVYEF